MRGDINSKRFDKAAASVGAAGADGIVAGNMVTAATAVAASAFTGDSGGAASGATGDRAGACGGPAGGAAGNAAGRIKACAAAFAGANGVAGAADGRGGASDAAVFGAGSAGGRIAVAVAAAASCNTGALAAGGGVGVAVVRGGVEYGAAGGASGTPPPLSFDQIIDSLLVRLQQGQAAQADWFAGQAADRSAQEKFQSDFVTSYSIKKTWRLR